MSGFTTEQVADFYRRQGLEVPADLAATGKDSLQVRLQISAIVAEPAEPKRRRHVAGRMNRLEQRFLTEIVEPWEASGDVKYWHFEAVNLRLADKTWWKPDFWVVLANGKQLAAEVKGHWEDDARVKIKLAAEIYPWLHIQAWMWDRKAKEWNREDF